MQILWKENPQQPFAAEIETLGSVGNFLGFSVASEKLQKHMSSRVQFNDGSRCVVHFGSPFSVSDPVKGKYNVLFTMYENSELPAAAIEHINKYQLVVVPSEWCRAAFSRQVSVPVEVCPLGVNTDEFKYKRRRLKAGKKFRFLYVGAANPRKFTVLPEVYRYYISKMPDTEIYIKTTGAGLGSAAGLAEMGLADTSSEEMVTGEGWTVDNRKLPQNELADLYHSAQAFLFLTCGEGFGLTGLEAMATGLPLVVSNWSGVTEYANSRNSTLVKCGYGDHSGEFSRIGFDTSHSLESEPMAYHVGWPDLMSAVASCQLVQSNYEMATRKARRARETAEGMTWESSAAKFCLILRKYGIV